jgi:hypothetical protein
VVARCERRCRFRGGVPDGRSEQVDASGSGELVESFQAGVESGVARHDGGAGPGRQVGGGFGRCLGEDLLAQAVEILGGYMVGCAAEQWGQVGEVLVSGAGEAGVGEGEDLVDQVVLLGWQTDSVHEGCFLPVSRPGEAGR